MKKTNLLNKILFPALLIFFLASVYFIVYIRSKKSGDHALSLGTISLSAKNELLTSQVLLQSRICSLPLKRNAIVEDTNGVKYHLSELFDTTKVIVYRISDLYCMECVKSQLPYLKTLSDRLGKKHVMLLASFETFKEFKIFMQTGEFDARAYNIQQQDLSNIPIEALNVPYFFEANGTVNADYVFIPAKEIPDLSKAYCDEVIRSF